MVKPPSFVKKMFFFCFLRGFFFSKTAIFNNTILHHIEENGISWYSWYLSFEPHLQQKYTFNLWKNVANFAFYLFLSSIRHSGHTLKEYIISSFKKSNKAAKIYFVMQS